MGTNLEQFKDRKIKVWSKHKIQHIFFVTSMLFSHYDIKLINTQEESQEQLPNLVNGKHLKAPFALAEVCANLVQYMSVDFSFNWLL